MNKKALEEEGMRFSTKNIAILIMFLVILAILMLLIIPRTSHQVANKTLVNSGEYILSILSSE